MQDPYVRTGHGIFNLDLRMSLQIVRVLSFLATFFQMRFWSVFTCTALYRTFIVIAAARGHKCLIPFYNRSVRFPVMQQRFCIT